MHRFRYSLIYKSKLRIIGNECILAGQYKPFASLFLRIRDRLLQQPSRIALMSTGRYRIDPKDHLPLSHFLMQVQAIQTKDGQRWWAAFTGFEEELKGSGSVMSTFLTDMEQLFRKALLADEIQGVILNPWQKTLMLDKTLIRIILGEE